MEQDNSTDIKQDTKEELIECPCCGKHTLQKPLNFSGMLFDHFMAGLVTGVPFSNVYPIYGGNIRITVTQLPKKEYNVLLKAVRALESLLPKAGREKDLVKDAIFGIQLYGCVTDICSKEFSVQPHDTIMELCAKINDLWMQENDDALREEVRGPVTAALDNPKLFSSVPMSIVSQVVSVHNKVYSLMMDASLDKNFWDGIVLL